MQAKGVEIHYEIGPPLVFTHQCSPTKWPLKFLRGPILQAKNEGLVTAESKGDTQFLVSNRYATALRAGRYFIR